MDKTLKTAYKGQLDPVKAEDLGGGLYDKVQAGIQTLDDNHRIRQQALPRNRRRKAPKTFIVMGGDQGRLLAENAHAVDPKVVIPKASTGAGREAFNRTAGLHEAAEMSAKARSPSRSSGGSTFFSHQGVQPMLNDVNIANTFQGPGARDLKAQVGAMRARELKGLKEDLDFDPRSVELIERLENGGRISRHGRKYLDRQYAQYVLQSWPRRKP